MGARTGNSGPIRGDDLDKLVAVFGNAWRAKDRQQFEDQHTAPGERTRAGLQAVFEEIEANGPNLGPDS
jgi:hypothetical protein